MSAPRVRDGLAILILTLLPLLWFAPVLVGGRTLLPADNLFAFEPWRTYAPSQGVQVPHNELLSDLVLENLVWKEFTRSAVSQGEIPLWNPYLFSGVPFLAAGQHSALYPFSLLFLILPLSQAYGWFTALQLALAGVNMYVLLRVLGRSRAAGVVGGITYACSAFFVTSVVFSMIIAAAAWLPLLLAIVEKVVQKQASKGVQPFRPVIYVVAGAIVLGIQVLAGHIEITYYTLMVLAYYSLWRLVALGRQLRAWRPAVVLGGWFVVMGGAGLTLAAVQLLPLFELVTRSFREGSVDYQQVVQWAWPVRQLLTFVVPDVFGNPTHHGYWDLWQRAWLLPTNSQGQPVAAIFWGIKNYVEGANYVGILPLLLAGIAGVHLLRGGRAWRTPTPADPPNDGRPSPRLFVVLALLSLAFAFGTPLYALLFYGLPGYSQLHSAFRWVFPLTLSLAVLAAYGWDVLPAAVGRRWPARWGLLCLGGSAALVGLLGLSLVWPAPFVALGERVLASSVAARGTFAGGAAFWSYQAANLAKLALALAGSGLVLLAAGRTWGQRLLGSWGPRWRVLAVGVVIADLWLATGHFNPAVDPQLLDFTPPAVAFLQQQASQELGRVSSFEGPATSKTLNANLAWRYGLQDVRGYDSIIPRQYVAYMAAIEPQGQLLYNRISPFYDLASLNDPRTHLLGVRWVVTELPLDVPGWTLIYDHEVKIYRNDNALPRAFVATQAAIVPPDQVLDRLGDIDPRATVLLDDPAASASLSAALTDTVRATSPVTVTSYRPNEVLIDVDLHAPGWLVLTDAYFPDWKAYVRPRGGTEGDEKPLTVWRADGNFRTVFLAEGGAQTVRFKYAPRSFQLGLFTSFVAFISLFLLLAWWLWGRYYRESIDTHDVRRVAKNSVVPVALALINKGIDFAFAMVRMRILSPAGEGSYTFAISFYVIFEILVRFGLGTLLTRDVAQDRSQARRYLANVTRLRLLLWVLSLPLLALVMAMFGRWGSMTGEEATAIGLFALALLFASLGDGVNAVFNAYEQMEIPAVVASGTALAKVTLGTLVLLPPLEWGFVGLAAVSVVMNLVQAIWLYWLMRQKLPVAPATRHDLDRGLQRKMLGLSTPLMLNHMLAHIFFRIDVWIIMPLAGAAAVGYYGAAYKYIDGLNVIPSYFTLAIFPLLARYARTDQANDRPSSLLRSYVLALRFLLMISLPLAVLITFMATPLIRLLGGSEYLPQSALALQILIWSIPFGFTNSVTQYVLIAVNQQRYLTRAFVIGVVFNIVANLLVVPRFGIYGAAVVTIFSELALLIPFMISTQRHVGPVPWLRVLGQPLLASAAMVAILGLGQQVGIATWVLATLAAVAYVLALVASGMFRDNDMAAVFQALPLDRLRARLRP